MAPITETTLLTKLQNRDYKNLKQDYTEYLSSFSDFISPNFFPTPKKKKKKPDEKLIRPLAKQFLPFISSSLKLLPIQLTELHKTREAPELVVVELFDVFKLCLECLSCISVCLECKPVTINLQRKKLVVCYEIWGKYIDAEVEGLFILNNLKNKGERSLLPDFGNNEDTQLASLVVEIVIRIVRCSFTSKRKEDGVYRRVIGMVEGIEPWFRILDEKWKLEFVKVVYRCTLFVLEEESCLDGDLVHRFCVTVLKQCWKLSEKDHFFKIARDICYALSSQWSSKYLLIVDMFKCLMDFIRNDCEVGVEDSVNECVDIVDYCLRKCRFASIDYCKDVGSSLHKIASDYSKVLVPVDSILRLYAVGMCFMETNFHLSCNKSESSVTNSLLQLSTGSADLLYLADVLHRLETYFHKCSRSCKSEQARSSFPSYLNALAFVCHPLAKIVNKARQLILAEEKFNPLSTKLMFILDAFQQFCDAFFICCSCTSEKEREKFRESRNTLPYVAIAAFTISLRTDKNLEKSVCHIDCIFSSCWIPLIEMKFLIASLHNIGVNLYNTRQMKQASNVFELCCRSAWTLVSHVCGKSVERSEQIHDELSEEEVTQFVIEACIKSATLLDVLNQCESPVFQRSMITTLVNWSVTVDSFETLDGLTALVTKWVKIMCKDNKDAGAVDNAPLLYSLLSTTLEKRALRIIVEQELLAYEEMEAQNMNLCQGMQLKIVEILLRNIYATEDLEKARTLIKKGRLVMTHGIKGLSKCIKCLSEAISILEQPTKQTSSKSHQLAMAYCLRALCNQEVQPDSKVIMEDIGYALKLWSSINWSVDAHSELETGNAIQLLYCTADLLSMKGWFHFQYDLYKLIIIFLKRKGVPFEKCLAMLWANRRLTHALCTTPIHEDVVSSFAQHFDDRSNTVGFWISCIKDSQSLTVGFRQKFSLFDSILPPDGHSNPGSPLGSNVTVDEVKEAALALISGNKTNSNFLAGYLYHDLCERLFSSGHLIEALSFGRESLRLRTKLLQRKFICTFGKQPQSTSESGETGPKYAFDHAQLEVFGSVATEAWPHIRSWNLEQCSLTQWNVLQCYLESILQVGAVHEALGNASAAEVLLVQGKSISSTKGLPVFRLAFAYALGEIYCKKQLWDFAKYELKTAQKILEESSTAISCNRCQLILEVSIDQRIGDLTKICSPGIQRTSLNDSFSSDPGFYRSALKKLNSSEREVSFSFDEDTSQLDNRVQCPQEVDTEGSHLILQSKKSKKASKILPEKKPNLRMTRARSRSSHEKSVQHKGEVGSECVKPSSGNSGNSFPITHTGNKQYLEVNRPSMTEFGCGKNCWKCLLVKVMKSGKMQNFIYMKWEFHRKRLSLRLLNEIGNCSTDPSKVHKTHETLWESISMLFNRKSFCETYSCPRPLLLEFIGKESQGDVFAIERAAILYNLSWFSLKNNYSRTDCCELSHVQLPSILSWLLQAFILSREVPLLFQKVSRLLATIFLLSTSGEPFSLPLPLGNTLSGSYWAAFFHQASLGTYFDHQLCSKIHAPDVMDVEGSHNTASNETMTEVSTLLRFAPGSIDDLEKFVSDFFQLLPSITVICISLLGSDYTRLLSDVLPGHFSSPSCMLLSRLNSTNEPIVMLLPSAAIPEDIDLDAKHITLYEGTNSSNNWICPWGRTVVDDVAPQFKLILQENYMSSSSFPTVDTQENRSLWWKWRMKLNGCLDKFLRGIEESWLGPWKCLLLSEPLDSTWLNSVILKVSSALKCKFNFYANENLLRVILGGSRSVSEIEECITHLLLHNGCLTNWGSCPEKKYDLSSTTCDHAETCSGKFLHQLILEAFDDLEAECISREPIILVLDSDVQMLPWESLPVLRKNEAYRMPSVGSISALVNVNFHRQEITGRAEGSFPSIDPLDAFYLLNPSGDLSGTQVDFEAWFRDQKLEGKAGAPPSVEELVLALKNHDLFIYFGHGSGTQYISGYEIQKLESCAATLLMGCASGALPFMGCYNPQGAVIYYLLAGSPAIIANLWEVTDKDIDRFGKSMLSAWWLQERKSSTIGYNPVNLVEKFESMDIETNSGNATKKTSRVTNNDSNNSRFMDTHGSTPTIGSFMSNAREACTFPVLIGASPVCYGIPTSIRNKKTSL
ncbi:hypothetical protein IFM89_009819 [Coptis chinensis]|uniref:separase n=1 Tax=Coptis chinensis TaxID=261450 RepID=A0A835LU99_9MAGN|nr:hypothetical protein IFM89_009819 [Coptis chinensis]